MRIFLILFCLLICQLCFGQRYMVDAGGDTLLVFEEGQARSHFSGSLLYTLSDNKIYAGGGVSEGQLQFKLKIKDIFGKSRDFLYDASGKNVIWTVRLGTFFIGDSYGYDLEEVLGWMQPTDSSLLFVNGLDTTLMGQALGVGWEQNELMLIFDLFKAKNKLEARWKERHPSTEKSVLPPGVKGVIYPEYGMGTRAEWWWDGRLFYPRYVQADGGTIEWTFDGENLQPRFGGEIVDKYVWDGTYFEPLWDREGRDEWEWQGDRLEQAWLSGTNFYILVENSEDAEPGMLKNARIRPIYEGQEYENYLIAGQMPVPVALLKVIGLAYR